MDYVCSPECEKALQLLKELLTIAPVLSFPDFSRPFILETDASGTGLGAVLAQKQPDGTVHPIAYASRTLQKTEKNYGITELEGLGVTLAVKHFRPYLYGQKYTVYTDHQALKSLLNTLQPSEKLARWGMALQELDLCIQHHSGKANLNADALSRCPLPSAEDENPTEEVVAAVQVEDSGAPAELEKGSLSELQRRDGGLAPLNCYLEDGTLPTRRSQHRGSP